MKKTLILLLLSSGLFAQQKANSEKLKNDFNNNLTKQKTAVFEENKGQMKDQNWQARPDVLFYGKSEGMNYYIRNNGMSYQLSRVYSWKEEADVKRLPDDRNKRKVPDQIGTYRVDAEWLCFNENFSIEKGRALPGYNNYYNVPEGVEPALFVKQYEAVTLKNLWNGIDVHYYSTEGLLETDYLVAPGADYRQIQMEIKGADLSIDAEGYLVMKTPFGEIREGKLKVYQENKLIDAQWKLNQKADKIWQVSFDIPDFNPAFAMRIDPVVRVWGTYYGGSGGETAKSCFVDSNGCVFLTGNTSSLNYISSQGHQNVFAGGNVDAFIVKINQNGGLIWGSYFGGINGDYGESCVVDTNNYVIIAGWSSSPTGISFGSVYQTNYGGGVSYGDAFVSKFSTNGILVWASYFGGASDDIGYSCTVDQSGNIFLSGVTSSSNNISRNGFDLVLSGSSDAFLAKFNINGIIIWSSYYGGIGNEVGRCCISFNNFIFLMGDTESTSNISSNGFQNSYGGGNRDAFLVKFNTNGSREWATYYGGVNIDQCFHGDVDNLGNIFICGMSSSITLSQNGFQNTYGGGVTDAYIAKFNAIGNLVWCSYFGGNGGDYAWFCDVDNIGNVIVTGETSSITLSMNGFQNYFGGGNRDAYLIYIDSTGVYQNGTYYGGSSFDSGGSCRFFNNQIILFGSTASSNNISYLGNQNIYMGGGFYDSYIVKFLKSSNTNLDVYLNNSEICLLLYPNPVKEKATILLEGILDANDLELEVYDVMGKLIHKDSNYNDNSFEIFVSNWNTGIYIVNVLHKSKIIHNSTMLVE